MLCVCVMSQVPGTSRNTMMNFTCGCLGKLGSLREGGERKQPGATGKGVPAPLPPSPPPTPMKVRPLTHWELAFESMSLGSPMKANPSTPAASQHDRDKYCAGGQEPRAYPGPELHAEDPALPPPHRVGQEMAPRRASPRTPS